MFHLPRNQCSTWSGARTEVELPLEDVWLVASREARKVPRVRALMGFLAERFEESRSVMLGVR